MWIHHALHGYRDGHELLASSLYLTDRVWRAHGLEQPDWNVRLYLQLGQRSDLTGYLPTDSPRSFSYETGYPVGDIYVFARTWYDEDAPRTGCVLTHSLLIPRSYIEQGAIPDIYGIEHHFKRPPSRSVINSQQRLSGWGKEDLDFYREQLQIEPREMPDPSLPSSRGLAVNTPSILVYPSDGTRDVVSYLWRQYGPGAEAGWRGAANITFCTYSLRPLCMGDTLMRIQGVPLKSLGAFHGYFHLIQRQQ